LVQNSGISDAVLGQLDRRIGSPSQGDEQRKGANDIRVADCGRILTSPVFEETLGSAAPHVNSEIEKVAL
jgi:hypothetical protein